jgi:hypothetical protein
LAWDWALLWSYIRTMVELNGAGSPKGREVAIRFLQIQKVPYVGLTDSATAQLFFKLAIRAG